MDGKVVKTVVRLLVCAVSLGVLSIQVAYAFNAFSVPPARTKSSIDVPAPSPKAPAMKASGQKACPQKPGEPKIDKIIAGNHQATVWFTVADGYGDKDVKYTVTAKTGTTEFTGEGTRSPITVGNLDNDITYHFTVTAINNTCSDTVVSGEKTATTGLKSICDGNCRAFLSYSSNVTLLNQASYSYSSGSSRVKVNPMVFNMYIPDKPQYYLPFLIFANAKTSTNTVSSVKTDLLDTEGGLVSGKLEYDYFPYSLVFNTKQLEEGLNNNTRVQAYGLYFELFAGAKYIQGGGITDTSAPATASSAGNFLQYQAGAGFDVSLPLGRSVSPFGTSGDSESKLGFATLRALYIVNEVIGDSMKKIFPDSKRYFGYGSLSFDFFVNTNTYITLAVSGLNTNSKSVGDTAFVSVNLAR